MLRDYGGTGRPVVVVPSLINPPFIVDLTRQKSLLRWLAVLVVFWFLRDWRATTFASEFGTFGCAMLRWPSMTSHEIVGKG